MPTVSSWADPALDVPPRAFRPAARARAARRASADVRHLLWFRTRRASRPLVAAGLGGLVLLTAAAAVGPALLPGAGRPSGPALTALLVLPTVLAGFLAVVAVTTVASGGGVRLLSADAAAVHPLSATTDHLGALLLAPLNIAWVLQAWMVLGLTGFALGATPRLLPAQILVLLWLVVATAAAQAVAWAVELLRRAPGGRAAVRVGAGLALATLLGLQSGGMLVPLLDRAPPQLLVAGILAGPGVGWAVLVLAEVVAFLAVVAAGASLAHRAAARPPAEESRAESVTHRPRAKPRTVWWALVRVDRASVWRAVSPRRGAVLLGAGPGLVALAGGLPWTSLTVLPGLVGGGAVLLFGVNAWCLDGAGAVWRESLPVSPGAVVGARAYVLAEFLLVPTLLTVALAAPRAGRPDVVEGVAVLGAVLVVTTQLVATALRWSRRRPYAVDLRSARATPAPALVMLGYSVRLAASLTAVGVVFSVLASLPWWQAPTVAALVMLTWSGGRLCRELLAWRSPVVRTRVVAAVAA